MGATEIKYDRWGRMQYHLDYHFNHGKPYTVKESAFIVQNYRRGEVKSLALLVGRTEHCVRSRVNYLRKTNQFERLFKIDIGDWIPEDSSNL